MPTDFQQCLVNPVGFKGFNVDTKNSGEFDFCGETYTLSHGDIVIAAITSCTNTSNPDVLVAAGLLARNAVAKGLNTKPWLKTSLAPGSNAVTKYLEQAGLQTSLDALGFNVVGFGCTTCIGNSGDIPQQINDCIEDNDIVAAAILSGNRNFEGRVHPNTRANYLASPPLVVAYALAGNVGFDFASTPLGQDSDGKDVFLADIWPSKAEITETVVASVHASMFKSAYSNIEAGTEMWRALEVSKGKLYDWSRPSTYIHQPPFFTSMGPEVDPPSDIKDAYVLLNLGDSITTDHISPAGTIARGSPAARYLESKGVTRKNYNTYGSRRGNDEVMARGTFANIRLVNKFYGRAGPKTLHIPTGDMLYVYDAAERYMAANKQLIVLGGKMYGAGSSRDWAAKGPLLQGVKAVIVESFERIHRSNLVGMGILPLEYLPGQTADSLGLTGKELYSIDLTSKPLTVNCLVDVSTNTGITFQVKVRLDTAPELAYYSNGGILHYVIRKLL